MKILRKLFLTSTLLALSSINFVLGMEFNNNNANNNQPPMTPTQPAVVNVPATPALQVQTHPTASQAVSSNSSSSSTASTSTTSIPQTNANNLTANDDDQETAAPPFFTTTHPTVVNVNVPATPALYVQAAPTTSQAVSGTSSSSSTTTTPATSIPQTNTNTLMAPDSQSSSSSSSSAAKKKPEVLGKLEQELLELPEHCTVLNQQILNQNNPTMVIAKCTEINKQLKPTISANDLTALMNVYYTEAIKKVKDSLEEELKPNELYIQKKLPIIQHNEYCIIGDIHGSLHSLVKILHDLIAKEYLNNDLQIIEPNFYIIFTGDFVDRGMYGAEVWYLLLKLKLAQGNWDKVFILRGNHEDSETNKYCGYINGKGKAIGELFSFHTELKKKYPNEADKIIKVINNVYQYLPQALFIKDDGQWMMFCHAGLYEDTFEYDEYELVKKFLDDSYKNEMQRCLLRTQTLLNMSFPVTGFLTADISHGTFIERGTIPCLVKKGKAFKQLKALNIRVLCRGHQHIGAGLKVSTKEIDQPCDVRLQILQQQIPIQVSSDQQNIFTFTTATELGLSTDVFYGIIKFNEQWKQWQLIPHLIERKQQ